MNFTPPMNRGSRGGASMKRETMNLEQRLFRPATFALASLCLLLPACRTPLVSDSASHGKDPAARTASKPDRPTNLGSPDLFGD